MKFLISYFSEKNKRHLTAGMWLHLRLCLNSRLSARASDTSRTLYSIAHYEAAKAYKCIIQDFKYEIETHFDF